MGKITMIKLPVGIAEDAEFFSALLREVTGYDFVRVGYNATNGVLQIKHGHRDRREDGGFNEFKHLTDDNIIDFMTMLETFDFAAKVKGNRIINAIRRIFHV